MTATNDLNNQSTQLPGDEYIRVSSLCKDGNLLEYMYEDARTLPEAFRRGARVSNNGQCLGWRSGADQPYQWLTYDQVLERAKNFGSGLAKLGYQPGQSTLVGIYAQNRVEWVVTDQACGMYSMITVPLYDTLGPEAVTFIINQAGLNIVVCDGEAKAKLILNKAERTPILQQIVVMEPVSDEVKDIARRMTVEILSFSDVEEMGRMEPYEPVMPNPNDMATICYTSGTTGDPKGAMVTHGNIIAGMSGCCQHLKGYGDLTPDDITISYLPLAHMYERSGQLWVYMQGARIGFFRGNVRELMDDIKELKPTLVPVVPGVLNRIYDKVISQVTSSCFKLIIFNMAMRKKAALLRRGIICNNTIWDRLVFRKIQETLGGNVKQFCSCGAPMSETVLQFARCALGCHVYDCYGQTESASPATMTSPLEHQTGRVGPPIPSCSIKLVDVPDMEYFAENHEGEVCLKGPSVFKGYYNDQKKTDETIDKDGWLHTGDIGKWLQDGTLKIIDRKKHIFKLDQGEYIAPEKIENVYTRSQFIAQIFVHGDSLQRYLVAVVTPDPENISSWARSKGLTGTLDDFCDNKVIKDAILKDIVQLGKSSGLKGFEQVKDIYLSSEPFSIENGLMTPTFKMKRPELRKRFAQKIEEMYDNLNCLRESHKS
ncbi:long-chain-fatty-acid--CoA ligase 1-like [Saccoglossus kowalevskii]|uniref:Long-chain-fatty-acid--CoA ligase n=1 Tax=Saccoglossus kowalevskii TaxID=10224 RepID=A0ABM0ME16_SACKO|nr:PREDICTED: long-chain-fatty-acid--CoA ligase 1-like [Saccoglossus kowalevskii]